MCAVVVRELGGIGRDRYMCVSCVCVLNYMCKQERLTLSLLKFTNCMQH